MLRAVLLAAFAEGVLTLMDALIKLASSRHATLQIAFLRFAAGLFFASIVLAVVRPGLPTAEQVRAHALRAILVVTSSLSFFYALSQLPLADTVVLSFLSPLFVVLFAAAFLKERITAGVVIAIVMGFAGMAIIVGGQAGQATYAEGAILGAAAAVFSAIAYGLVIVVLRARATRDPIAHIVWFQNAGPALLLAVPAALAWAPLSPHDALLFLAIGAIAVAGHLAMTRAFSIAEAAKLAPVHYTTLVWGVAFGYLFFGDTPGLTTFIGAALIVLSTLVAQRR